MHSPPGLEREGEDDSWVSGQSNKRGVRYQRKQRFRGEADGEARSVWDAGAPWLRQDRGLQCGQWLSHRRRGAARGRVEAGEGREAKGEEEDVRTEDLVKGTRREGTQWARRAMRTQQAAQEPRP